MMEINHQHNRVLFMRGGHLGDDAGVGVQNWGAGNARVTEFLQQEFQVSPFTAQGGSFLEARSSTGEFKVRYGLSLTC